MIELDVARQLLDFGARIQDEHRAQEQLEGAVALHHLLSRRGVAYLADEVGLGKTYVALGALALFRHFHPGFRTLVIAPQENLQLKWIKELGNFVTHNVRFADLRVKALHGASARGAVKCDSLVALLRETTLDPDRDFFVRLSSFSLTLGDDPASWRRLRDELKRHVPWVDDARLDLRNKQEFKAEFARILCCALPVFDLVIIDEGHNLKHGLASHASARNQLLAAAFGHPSASLDRSRYPSYGPRAQRVLFLSATPLETSYRQLWNQLDIMGHGKGFEALKQDDRGEAEHKRQAAEFMIRRVGAIRIAGQDYTKNLYRRDWRRGGLATHDDPIRITDPRQRLVVALVQKKVSELLGHERFNARFQIGMLASFESFLETAKLRRSDPEAANFDDVQQTDDLAEREGIDTQDINQLARTYRARFGQELPHPKMDALVERLADAWRTGRKSLVFVRRVASVKELKRKLDDAYDAWLIGRLRQELPAAVQPQLEAAIAQYQLIHRSAPPEAVAANERPLGDEAAAEDDQGGTDTFFAWFFRGTGPEGIVSGANVQRRFIQQGSAYATFFERNHVAELLQTPPARVMLALCEATRRSEDELRTELRRRGARFLGQSQARSRRARFEAAQAATLEMLLDSEAVSEDLRDRARLVWDQCYQSARKSSPAPATPDLAPYLATRTFWTELPTRPELCRRLWPEPSTRDPLRAFRERELRAQLLAAAARLGHAFIDLYLLTIRRLGSLEPRTVDAAEGTQAADRQPIHEYLELLEAQLQATGARPWGALDELELVARHFELILDVNAPELQEAPLSEAARQLAVMMSKQQPTGGMFGKINRTLVRQFRMPGYPFVLLTTDLLQEGEDLHTFCSEVHHYGISWTSSAMEQRIGRVDRVRSATDRRLRALEREPSGEELLQVTFPHLEDTVELLQVRRVLHRMNEFLRLMHEGLGSKLPEARTVALPQEILTSLAPIPRIEEKLESAFPVRPEHLTGEIRQLAVDARQAIAIEARFRRLAADLLAVPVTWTRSQRAGTLLGTAHLSGRVQPFTLILSSMGDHLLVRCISPIGQVDPGASWASIVNNAASLDIKVGAILTRDRNLYDLTVEDDVLLGDETHDRARVGALILRVATWADEMEQRQLPGRDEPLETFQADLEEEMLHGS